MIVQGRSVLIKPDELPEKTAGGILVPKTLKEKPMTGMVVDHGSACVKVSVASRVQYARKSASVINHEGEELHFVTEDKIFYIYG